MFLDLTIFFTEDHQVFRFNNLLLPVLFAAVSAAPHFISEDVEIFD